jgi:hypothetical protein
MEGGTYLPPELGAPLAMAVPTSVGGAGPSSSVAPVSGPAVHCMIRKLRERRSLPVTCSSPASESLYGHLAVKLE